MKGTSVRKLGLVAVFCVMCLAGAMTVTGAETQWKAFDQKGFGFTMNYPVDWTFQTQEPGTVLFMGRDKDSTQPTVAVQNLNSTAKPGGKYGSMESIITDMESQLRTKALTDVKVFPSQRFIYGKKEKTAGKQFSIEYTIQGEKFRQWVVIIPRKDKTMYHAWFYTSPMKKYEGTLPLAKNMLASFAIAE